MKGNVFYNDILDWEPFPFGDNIIVLDVPSDDGIVLGAAAPFVS